MLPQLNDLQISSSYFASLSGRGTHSVDYARNGVGKESLKKPKAGVERNKSSNIDRSLLAGNFSTFLNSQLLSSVALPSSFGLSENEIIIELYNHVAGSVTV